MDNEQRIWCKLISYGFTKAGAAGLMGNLYAESALNPHNLQNTYERSLGYDDESYTQAVDNGTYQNFIRDQAGYGLAQWTHHYRKGALLTYAKNHNASIGDLDMQLDFIIYELEHDFPATIIGVLRSTNSVAEASNIVMTNYENPADQSDAAKAGRAAFGTRFYQKYVDMCMDDEVVLDEHPPLPQQQGEINMSTKLRGIDVSKHNGKINWDTLKASGQVDYVILRAGYGKLTSQKDQTFETNYANAKRVGIPVGCYWFSYAKSVTEAQQEARTFLKVIKGKQFEYPVYLDLEEESQFKLGKNVCSAMAIAFMNIVQQAGYFVGIYSSKSGFTYMNDTVKTDYTVWVAQINIAQTTYSGAYDMWQYSFTGSIPGINGKVDLDYCYKDFPSIIKRVGLNGYPKNSNNGGDSTGSGPELEPPPAPIVVETAPDISQVTQKNDEKTKKKITLIIDDHQYSGLLEED